MSKKIKITKILSKPCQNHLQICVQSLIVKMNYVSAVETCLIDLKRLWMTCYYAPMFITAGLLSRKMRKSKKKKKEHKGCLNAQGNCKARFPRELFEETQVDPKTGALNVKKGEEWVNTFTVLLTYLLRSNSDVTSLLSGTAIKAIVAYISDYVTKPGLKTYSIFDTITGVFARNSEMIGGNAARKDKARVLITQIVNY